ncbi:serine/threonine-protein phosphatase 6 regulatory ankyrin repeat subunit B-like [Haliotis rubra]|uniref:serine/threonine-protein phosphatase 6 regulatory ankyrin repeat subunit B-like n=1 Tax=Haliotis rubra TaxID=36100 RepID=UPI001EE61826|nr:serine/threonine-protein phosphatase 6 regulatory ankyrin repeat subunit B-like [Haliotis rubra]
MLLLCSSNGLQAALTTSVYVLAVLSTCSTEECGLQLTEKMKNRSVVFRNVEKMSCQTTCFEESFIFASCHQSSGEVKKIEKKDGSSVRPVKRPRLDANFLDGFTGIKKSIHRRVSSTFVAEKGFGINTLHSACLGGDVEVVKYVLSQNMLDINDKVHCGRTAVMLAGQNGHKEVVELCVTHGAKLSLKDRDGENILHIASNGGHLEVVKYILSLGTVDIDVKNKKRQTAVGKARENRHRDVVDLLVTYGALT